MILTKIKNDAFSNGIDFSKIINNLFELNDPSEWILVVPTNRKMRSMQSHIMSNHPKTASQRLNLHTIRTITRLLVTKSNIKGRIVDETEQGILLESAITQKGDYFFRKYKSGVPRGIIDKLRNVFNELKEKGATPLSLSTEATELIGVDKKRAEEFAAIFTFYNDKLKAHRLFDTGDIYATLQLFEQNEIDTLFRNCFPNVKTLVFDGYSEFSVPEVKIINLLANVPELKVFINLDYNPYNPVLFSRVAEMKSLFLKCQFEEIQDVSEVVDIPFIKILRNDLFATNKKNFTLFNNKPELQIAPRSSIAEEVSFIAAEIKEILLDEKKRVKPYKIAVLFSSIEKYSPYVRDIFELYGIPFNLTDRLRLADFQPIIATIAMLELIDGDFFYSSLMKAFESEFYGISDITAHDIKAVASELKIKGGYKNWIERLNEEISLGEDVSNEYNEEQNVKRFKQQRYKNVLAVLEKLNIQLSPFTNKLTPNAFLRELLQLVYSYDLPSKILCSGSVYIEENLAAFEKFVVVIERLTNILSEEYDNSKTFSLSTYIKYLRTAIQSTRFNIPERPNYGVLITTPDEIRGLTFDYLFVGDLIDGDFPVRFNHEIYKTEDAALKEKKHYDEQRYLFYKVLSTASSTTKSITFTYPEKEEQAELIESYFLREFKLLFADSIKLNSEKKRNSIYGEHELLTESGALLYDELVKSRGVEPNAIQVENLLKPINDFFNRHPQIKSKFEEIAKAIKIEIDRTENKSESEYKGFIGADALLNEKMMKPLSVSSLESFAKCPFKYLAEKLVYLHPIKDPTEESEGNETGELLHTIMSEFYRYERNLSRVIGNCSEEEFTVFKQDMVKIAQSTIDKMIINKERDYYIIEKIVGRNGDLQGSLLLDFLQFERNNLPEINKDFNLTPEFFEFKFDSVTLDEIPNLSFSGRVDRVDVNEQTGRFRVIDYKSKKKSSFAKNLERGIELQLPVYNKIITKLLSDSHEMEFSPVLPSYYILGEGSKMELNRVLRGNSKETDDKIELALEKLYADLESKIVGISEKIKRGEFGLSPHSDRETLVCKYCEFKMICRVQTGNTEEAEEL